MGWPLPLSLLGLKRLGMLRKRGRDEAEPRGGWRSTGVGVGVGAWE